MSTVPDTLFDDNQFRELLTHAKGGDKVALGTLLEANRLWLLAKSKCLLSPKLQSKVGSSDLVQDTCKSVQEYILTFAGNTVDEWCAWVTTILENKAAAQGNHFQTEKRNIDKEQRLPLIGRHHVEQTIYSAPSPGSQVVLNEQVEKLRKSIMHLPEQMRLVLELRYRDQLKYLEIGVRLGKSEEAVKKLCARAIKRLQESI